MQPETSRSATRWRWWVLVAAAVALLGGAYGTALTQGPFGINDDYQFLRRVQEGTFDPAHNEIAGMGRPLEAWICEAAYGLCGGRVSRLVWLRAGAIVGLGLLGWTLLFTLGSAGYSRGLAATVAALAILSPAGGVMAAWAAAGVNAYAMIAALLAGRLLIGATGLVAEGAAILIFVATCAVWQAAAPLILFPALVCAWSGTNRRASSPIVAKPWWRPWLVSALAALAYLAASRAYVHLIPVHGDGVERAALTTDVAGKLRLLAVVLRNGFTGWARLESPAWQWGVGTLTAAVCVTAVVVRVNGSVVWPTTARRGLLAMTMLLVSVAPLLAAKEDNATFRSLAALYVTVAFLAGSGWYRLAYRWPARAALAGVLLLFGADIAAARYHVWHGLVEPNVREYTGIREVVRRQFPQGAPAQMVYLVPPYTAIAEPYLRSAWEYGLTSSTFWWVTRPFLADVFADVGGDSAKPFKTTLYYREVGHPGIPVLESLPALLGEGQWRDDPLWGRVRVHSGAWLYSPWFGYFNLTYDPFVRHHILGTMWVTNPSEPKEHIWFFHDGLGHWATTAEKYPHIWLGGTGRQLTIRERDPLQLQLVDDLTGEVLPYPP